MPDIQFWDDKLTEEIQVIRILLASRDDMCAIEEDDKQIDKLMSDANRTRRCFRAQTKMLRKDDPDATHFSCRLQQLDAQLSDLELDWQSVDRTYGGSEEEEEEGESDSDDRSMYSYSSQQQQKTNNHCHYYECDSHTVDTCDETVTEETSDESALFDESSSRGGGGGRRRSLRPGMVRSNTTFRCGPEGRPRLMRSTGTRAQAQKI